MAGFDKPGRPTAPVRIAAGPADGLDVVERAIEPEGGGAIGLDAPEKVPRADEAEVEAAGAGTLPIPKFVLPDLMGTLPTADTPKFDARVGFTRSGFSLENTVSVLASSGLLTAPSSSAMD